MELKEGMFVRTNNGITKIIGKNDDVRYYYPNAYISDTYLEINEDTEYLYEEDILKASHNILDLIEVGDLLKIEYYSLRYEERVTRLFEVTYKDEKYINLSNAKCEFMLIENEFNKGDKELEPIIKSVVTKEQIENMEYIVGGM